MGWKPSCFIMLPIFGPSNERDTIGLAADTAANPLLYIAPYDLDAANPLTYLGPYSYFSYAVMYNDLADSVGEYVRFSQAEWTPIPRYNMPGLSRVRTRCEFHVQGKQDESSLETLESVFFTSKTRNSCHSQTKSVRIPATARI